MINFRGLKFMKICPIITFLGTFARKLNFLETYPPPPLDELILRQYFLCISTCVNTFASALRLTPSVTLSIFCFCSHGQNRTINNTIESIYTDTMFNFDTMSNVCIILFQTMQKFDVINFYPILEKKIDLH